ncbi:MAG: hypothetical protein ACOY3P_15270 [Planctomycetota bacterium]
MNRFMITLFFVLTGLTAIALAPGADPLFPSAAGAEADVDRLIEDLDADDFATREGASKQLESLGQPAAAPLAKAATVGSLEVTSRALEILKRLSEDDDAAKRDAARAALEEVAASGNPSAARRAREALGIDESNMPEGSVQMGPNGVLQLRAARGRSVSISTSNGVRTIRVTEGDEQTKIVDDPNKGIEVEITTKKDGKEQTEKIEAKNADELKKKNEKAHALYQQYGQKNIVAAPAAVPQPAQLKSAAMLLKSIGAHISRMATKEIIEKSSGSERKDLQEAIGEMRKQLDVLEKNLKEAETAKADDARQPAAQAPAAIIIEAGPAQIQGVIQIEIGQ